MEGDDHHSAAACLRPEHVLGVGGDHPRGGGVRTVAHLHHVHPGAGEVVHIGTQHPAQGALVGVGEDVAEVGAQRGEASRPQREHGPRERGAE